MALRPNVVIVGGGIGGLFAANALLAQGLRVSVYEQASALGEIGAGVFVTPNAVRHLERVGLGAAVEKWGARVGPGSFYFRHDGTPIAPVQVSDASGWNAAFGMHRADLVEFLAANLPSGVVRTGHRAVGFEQNDEWARVRFANGAVVEADVVVAADGIHSELRPHVFPPSKPIFHGTISYRGLIARERLPDWPMDRWQMWAGPSKHFLVFPVRHGAMINYVGFVPTDEEMKESWSAPGDPDVLRRAFEGWDPRIGDVLQQVDKTFRWALYDREPLPTWTQGRLTLLGDAAHPMLRISVKAPISRLKTAWRSRPSWPRRTHREFRRRSWPTSDCVASASRRFSAVRAGTGCVSIRPTPISVRATRSLRRMPNSASICTPTTSCRRRAPQRSPSEDRAAPATARPASLEQAGLPCHFADAAGFEADLGRRLLGRRVALKDAERREPARDAGGVDGLLDRADQGLSRFFRNPRRREKAEPDAEQLLVVAELAHRRDVDEVGKPARRDEAAERP